LTYIREPVILYRIVYIGVKFLDNVKKLLFVLFVLWFSVASNMASAQELSVPVGVTIFAGDDADLSGRIRETAVEEVENQAGFTAQLLDIAGSDEPPDSSLLTGMPYVLTGEYYFDDEDMEHFQMWLWISDTGSLVFTDELVAESIDEAEEYLPSLVAWLFSKIEPTEAETTEMYEIETYANEAYENVSDENEPEPARTETVLPELYLGLRGGVSLDLQLIRTVAPYNGDMSQSIGGEGAFTVEFRPWQYMSFQAEGIFMAESFAAYRLDTGNDRYQAMSLLFPLLVKATLDLKEWRLSFLGGAYYILPLRRTMGGASYKDNLYQPPIGVIGGLDLGRSLGRFGELYGSLRFGYDLALTEVKDTGLAYSRRRLIFSLGYKIGLSPLWSGR
jgi:hypothetical protein